MQHLDNVSEHWSLTLKYWFVEVEARYYKCKSEGIHSGRLVCVPYKYCGTWLTLNVSIILAGDTGCVWSARSNSSSNIYLSQWSSWERLDHHQKQEMSHSWTFTESYCLSHHTQYTNFWVWSENYNLNCCKVILYLQPVYIEKFVLGFYISQYCCTKVWKLPTLLSYHTFELVLKKNLKGWNFGNWYKKQFKQSKPNKKL